MRKETRGRKPKDPKVAISHGQLIALRFTQQDYPAIETAAGSQPVHLWARETLLEVARAQHRKTA